jgi:hypothetical protein
VGSSDDVTKVEGVPRGVLKSCAKCGHQERLVLRPKTSRQTALWLAGFYDRSILAPGRKGPSGMCGSCGFPVVCTIYGYPESEKS